MGGKVRRESVNDSILAITVLLGLRNELWFENERPSWCWEFWLYIKRN